MAGALRNDDDPISEINVTPFVDVVLVLLVIFMVTASFMVNKGVKVELPQAGTAEQLKEQSTLNVLVKRDGSLFLDGRSISTAELQNLGKQALQSSKKVVVGISADKGVIYSSVVEVMDSMRQSGISDFALQMDPMAKK